MDSTVISISNLKKTYGLSKPRNGQTTFHALKGVSFFVKKGEIFGILGPNGAGKTTTLEIIEGLKQQDSGEAVILGLDNRKNRDEIKKRVGVQLQSSDYLPHLTLGELLDLFASLYNCKADHKKLLALVELEEKEHEFVQSLSGGQKQRFTIATCLVNDPEIIFLDEPTTGLDPQARRNLWELIRRLNASGMTIVLTTHYMEEAEYLCRRVAIMDEGTILEIDEPSRLIDRLSQTTQVSFLSQQPVDEKIFAGLSDIEKIYNRFPKTILELKSLDGISKIVEILKQHSITFAGFAVRTASLEDVYLDLTGKEYEG